jgi:hypothetical protein
MRFDLHLREDFKTQVSDITAQMKEWETVPRIDESEQESVRDRIQPFDHTTHVDRLLIAGVDGSGDYPCVTYSDSFVYVTVAHGTVYESNTATGLKELPPICKPLVNVAWMSEQSEQRHDAWNKAFESLAGRSIEQSIERSDYQNLKAAASGRATSVSKLNDELLRPHAHDSGNVAIQLRSLGELGAALRLIESEQNLDFVLVDGTLSLPLVTRRDVSLFYEHVKRLCCVSATQRNIGFFAVSKSHGLPSIELIESLAQQKINPTDQKRAEHWFLRVPVPGYDKWKFGLTEDRNLPPLGAVTYLVRFHRSIPVLRLDMDRDFWERQVLGPDVETTIENERSIFQKLDYACHDQRCFGYPYPIKAGHDRASLTTQERTILRKQIVDAAVEQGLKRSLFRDASLATGHK